jgi:hypothetical protein
LGFFLGLSFYTYTAARALPFIFTAYLAYLTLFHREQMRGRWSALLVSLMIAAVVVAPLAIWLATHPGAEPRVADVRGPLDRLMAGNLSPVWNNIKANLGMFTSRGDAGYLHNLPDRPVFPDLVNGLLFCFGVGIAFWHWRDLRYSFLLIWSLGSLIPSIVTVDAPGFPRDILAQVVVFAFPALALAWIAHRLALIASRSSLASTLMQKRSASLIYQLPLAGLLVLPLLLSCWFTVRDYFIIWSQHDGVRFVYPAALTAAARRVDELGPGKPVVVAGLAVYSMDMPGIELASKRKTDHVRLSDTRETLVVPAEAGGRLLVPEVVPFSSELRGRLLSAGGREVSQPGIPFAEYILPEASAVEKILRTTPISLPNGIALPLPASFGDQLALVGTEWIAKKATPGSELVLLTAWQVESPPSSPLRIFVHLLDAQGRVRAQHDGLESPPHGWTPGDLILQLHTMDLPTDLEVGVYSIEVGLYWPKDGQRLFVAGADRLLLTPIKVKAQ